MKTVDKVIEALSFEIDKLHYQSKESNKKYLIDLLNEVSNSKNLALELIYALETYLEK